VFLWYASFVATRIPGAPCSRELGAADTQGYARLAKARETYASLRPCFVHRIDDLLVPRVTSFLDVRDRISASLACRAWRFRSVGQPRRPVARQATVADIARFFAIIAKGDIQSMRAFVQSPVLPHSPNVRDKVS
jgi:hypothetical protein